MDNKFISNDIVAGVAEFISKLKRYKPGDEVTVVDRRQKTIIAKIKILPCPDKLSINQSFEYRRQQ